MIKNQKLALKTITEYKEKKKIDKQIKPVKTYKLPHTKWVKKDKEKEIYDLISNSLGWSMKVIGKTGSGKTTFISAFLEFLIDYIDGVENIYLLSPTCNQNEWDSIRNSVVHIKNIDEIVDCNNSIIVCDDTQVQLKGNKVITEMILNKRHRNLGIILCE